MVGVADAATCRPDGRQEAGPFPGGPVSAPVLAAGWRGRWTGQAVSLYRAAQTMMSTVATIWIPPSTMKAPAWMAMARDVVRTEATSHTLNASGLMPAEQRARMRWEICGT